jgi:hypothetical protein
MRADMRSRIKIWVGLLKPGWNWLVIVPLTILGSLGTVRDQLIVPERPILYTVAYWLPDWPWPIYVLTIMILWLIVILESSYRIIKKRDKEICDLKSPRIKLSFNENDERTVCPLDGTKKYCTIRVENTCVTLIENCLLEISYNCRGPHTVLRPFDIRPLGIETCCFIASYTIHEYVTVESVLLSGNRWVDIPGGYILSKDNYLFKITASANNSPPAVIKLRIHRSNGHLTMKNESLTD